MADAALDNIHRLKLTARASNALKEGGITTITEILALGPVRLAQVRGVGKATADEIWNAAAATAAESSSSQISDDAYQILLRNGRVQCIKIATEINARDPGDDCLGTIAFISQKLASWIFSGPKEFIASRAECLSLAIKTMDTQHSANEAISAEDYTPPIVVGDPVTFVLRTAKAYANYIERDSWSREIEDA
ncbi:DNA-directed RNA polymerase subunit alpha C-terminal domain-containing protein [Acidocella aminolytica]|nr:DNA-directed RNA polymerase subunit alpha C-terminal domain-containing protein [Acidocella aminolytica]